MCIKVSCSGLVEFASTHKHTLYGLGVDSTRRLDLQFLELVKDVPGAIAKIYANFYPGQAGPSPKALAAFEEYLLSPLHF